MKITCLKNDLERALNTVQKAVSKNQAVPAIENVLFEARGDELFIKATNIEVFVEYKITVALEKDGEFLIPVDILLQSIKNSNTQNKKITLELKKNTLHIKDGNSNFTIKTVNKEDFPIIKKPESLKNTKNTIDKDVFLKGVKSVYLFSSNMLVKPELSSVYIHKEDDNLVYVSTDQFRLAEKKIKHNSNENFQNILIPIKNINIIIKILESTEEQTLRFVSEENQLSFESDNLFVSSRILDLSFPDYKNIIPKEYKTKLIVLKEDFLNSLKKTALFTDKFGKTEISLNNKKILLKTENKDIGEIEEQIDVVQEGEDNFKLNINNKYLQEGVLAINSDSVELWFLKEGSPLLLKGVGDDSFVYILMPMNN